MKIIMIILFHTEWLDGLSFTEWFHLMLCESNSVEQLPLWLMGRTGFKFDSWKCKITLKMHLTPFYCFLKEMWILKSSYRWKSPMMTSSIQHTLQHPSRSTKASTSPLSLNIFSYTCLWAVVWRSAKSPRISLSSAWFSRSICWACSNWWR